MRRFGHGLSEAPKCARRGVAEKGIDRSVSASSLASSAMWLGDWDQGGTNDRMPQCQGGCFSSWRSPCRAMAMRARSNRRRARERGHLVA